MDDFNCADYRRNARAKRFECGFSRHAKLVEVAKLVDELFGDEGHLTEEMIYHRLKVAGKTRFYDRVMQFLCKHKRVLRGF